MSSNPAEIYVYDGNGKWVSISPHIDTSVPPAAHRHPATDIDGIAKVATTGEYPDLLNRPTQLSDFVNDKAFVSAPDLATVATTGSYKDLIDEPKLLSEFTNDQNFVDYATARNAAPVQSIVAGANVSLTDDGKGNITIASTGTGSGGPVGGVTSVSAVAPLSVADGLANAKISLSIGSGLKVVGNDLVLDEASLSLSAVAHSGDYADLLNTPTIPPAYTLPTASAGNLGGVKIGTGIDVDMNGVISVTPQTVPDATTLTKGIVLLADYSAIKAGTPGAVVDAAQLKGAMPVLATVATSGDYNDLSNLPSIPPAQVQSDWMESNSSLAAFIKGKPTNLSEFTNDSGYINMAQVPASPVSSVNGKVGAVVLAATDVGALPDTTAIPTHTSNLTNDSGFINLAQVPAAPVSSVNGKTGAVVLTADSVGALPNTTTIPTHTSNLANDSGYINLAQVPAAPVSSVNGKTGAVVLNAASVGALPNTTIIPTHTSNLANDSGYITLSQVPDAPVQSIKAGSSNVTVSDDGAGNYTIDGSKYALPPANTTALGGVIVGDGLNVAANGTVSLGDLHLPVQSDDGSVVLQDAAKHLQVLTDGATRMTIGMDGTEVIGQIKAGKALVGAVAGDGLPSVSIGGGPAFDNGGGTASVVQVSKSLKGTISTISGFLNQVGFVNCQVGTYRGIVQSNPDAAFFGTTTVQLYEGFSISAMPASLDAKVLDACSIHVAMNDSGTATRWNVKASGSAPNMFSGNVVIGSSNKPEVALEVWPQRGLALKTSYPPNSETSNGVRGELAWDSQYIYICVNNNTWRRIPLQNFDGSPSTRVAVGGVGSGSHN